MFVGSFEPYGQIDRWLSEGAGEQGDKHGCDDSRDHAADEKASAHDEFRLKAMPRRSESIAGREIAVK